MDPLLDPLRFAYRANRSVDNAVNIGLHFMLQHLDCPRTYVRTLFVDFSSALIPFFQSYYRQNSPSWLCLIVHVDSQLPYKQNTIYVFWQAYFRIMNWSSTGLCAFSSVPQMVAQHDHHCKKSPEKISLPETVKDAQSHNSLWWSKSTMLSLSPFSSIQSFITVWLELVTKWDKARLQCIIYSAETIFSCNLPPSRHCLYCIV